jgi:hypothetical protein
VDRQTPVVTIRLRSTLTGIEIEWIARSAIAIPQSMYPFVVEHLRAMQSSGERGLPDVHALPERHPHRQELPKTLGLPMSSRLVDALSELLRWRRAYL